MGLKFRKRLGSKHLKLNISKNGVTSTSLKVAKGVTLNSKRGLTIGLPGTGLSYNFSKKNKKVDSSNLDIQENSLPLDKSNLINENFQKVTGGYSKKAIYSVVICIIMLFTPLNLLGLVLLIPSLLWFIIDTVIKIIKTKKVIEK